MDNLSDWLYIVLLAIAGISGLFSSEKKKNRSIKTPQKQSTNSTNENYNPERSFWNMFEEVKKEQPSSSPKQVKLKQTKIKSQPDKQPVETENDPFHLSLESFHDNTEELKKAIIYSEILNRKY